MLNHVSDAAFLGSSILGVMFFFHTKASVRVVAMLIGVGIGTLLRFSQHYGPVSLVIWMIVFGFTVIGPAVATVLPYAEERFWYGNNPPR